MNFDNLVINRKKFFPCSWDESTLYRYVYVQSFQITTHTIKNLVVGRVSTMFMENSKRILRIILYLYPNIYLQAVQNKINICNKYFRLLHDCVSVPFAEL